MLAHLTLLGLGVEALRQSVQDSLPSRPATAPAALHVRHLTSAAPAAQDVLADTAAAEPGFASGQTAPSEQDEEQPAVAPSVVEPAIYVPRALLTVPPVARTPVLLEWPANWLKKTSYTGILRLYLDEEGRVERVEPDSDAVLPEPLFETARQAFLATSFTPGQLNGQAVKSRIRVEVSFETSTPPLRP